MTEFKGFTWRQEHLELENGFVKNIIKNYNIKEVTTQRQAKNGTTFVSGKASVLKSETTEVPF